MALTRNDEIAVLLEFNTRLVAGDPPAVLLPRIVEEAERLTGGDAVVIRLLEGDWLVLSTCSSRAEALNLEKRLPAEAGIVGRVARDGVPLMSRDIAGDERFYAPHLAAVLAAGFRSFVTLPLRASRRTIGTMSVYGTRPDAFEDKNIDLLGAFADQAAIALERARLLDRSRRQTERLVALHRIASSILRQSDEGRTLDEIVEEARGLLGVSGVLIYLWDEDLGRLRVGPSTAPPSPNYPTVAAGEGATGRAFAERRVICVPDYSTSDYAIAGTREFGVHALVAAPLLVGDRALGSLAAWTTDPYQQFSPDEEQVVLLFAEQAALAIENARLRQTAAAEADAAAAELVADGLLRAAEALAQAQTTTDVTRTLAELGPRLFQCDATIVRIRRADGTFQAANLAGDITPGERSYILRHNVHLTPLFAKISQERRVVAVEDVPASGLVPEEELANVRRCSTMVVPLLAHGDLLGYVAMNYTREKRRFSPRDITLAEGIARQAAMALDNLRLRQRDWEAARLDGALQAARGTAHELNEPLTQLAREAELLLAAAQPASPSAESARRTGRAAGDPLLARLDGVARSVDAIAEKVRQLQLSIHLDRANPSGMLSRID